MKYLKEVKMITLRAGLLALLFVGVVSCGDDNNDVAPPGDDDDDVELPAVFEKFNDDLNIYVQGDFVVIESTGIPDHKSPYFGNGHQSFEAYNGNNPDFNINPNVIQEQTFVFKLPLNPEVASTKTSTQLGAIGVSINGVVIFNQYAGPNNQPLTGEIDSFDQYNGHPQQSGEYHYHIEPLYLTAQKGRSALVGFLLDGFPLYGPEENGSLVNNAALDQYHGHSHATDEYPNGIYHYHITAEDPYINGGQYYGTPGSATN